VAAANTAATPLDNGGRRFEELQMTNRSFSLRWLAVARSSRSRAESESLRSAQALLMRPLHSSAGVVEGYEGLGGGRLGMGRRKR
jgi:hypothetical protein